MLMPKKHINLSESLIGIGALILKTINNTDKTIDSILKEVDKLLNRNKSKALYNNIDNMLLSIDYLYSIGAIDIDKEGKIYNVLNRTKC